MSSDSPSNGNGQSLGVLYRRQRDASAPADVCVAVGLPPGATWGEAIVRSQFLAATKAGDMTAARDIADRLEGKTPSADAAQPQKSFRITVVSHDGLSEPLLREIAVNIVMRVPSPKMWEFFEQHLETQLPEFYAVARSELDGMSEKETVKLRRSLQAESLTQARARGTAAQAAS